MATLTVNNMILDTIKTNNDKTPKYRDILIEMGYGVKQSNRFGFNKWQVGCITLKKEGRTYVLYCVEPTVTHVYSGRRTPIKTSDGTINNVDLKRLIEKHIARARVPRSTEYMENVPYKYGYRTKRVQAIGYKSYSTKRVEYYKANIEMVSKYMRYAERDAERIMNLAKKFSEEFEHLVKEYERDYNSAIGWINMANKDADKNDTPIMSIPEKKAFANPFDGVEIKVA